MDTPSSIVPHEALQRRAYLLWEAAGFPPGRADHFWLMAEQERGPVAATASLPAAADPQPSDAAPQQSQGPPDTAAEAPAVHPARKKPASITKPPPAERAPAKTAAKAPRKTILPSVTAPVPAAKRPTRSRKPKSGDAA